MPIAEPTLLAQEWLCLQNYYEQYEKTALLIKLAAVLICFTAHAYIVSALVVAPLLLILWVQEGIFRTYQARLGERILRIESLIKENSQADNACQFHSEWLAGRKGFSGLLREYAASIAKPTVAFPYAVLFMFTLLLTWQ